MTAAAASRRATRFDAILLDEEPSDLALFAQPGAVTGVFKGGAPVVRHERLEAPV